jgi:flagellar hook-associated protein 2
MGYDPSTQVTGATQTSAAADANATINGVSVTSSSNIFSNVMDGVSLTANAVTTAAATVSVSADTATIKTTLQSFATAYSALNSRIATDTKYDSTSKQSGPLQGDSTVVGVQTSLRTLLGATSTASSAFSRMSDVGFQVQQDGSLTLNSTTADNALTNLSQMKALFVGNTSTSTSAQGFAQQFYNATYNMLTIGGSVNSHSSALSDRLQRNRNQQDAMDVRLARTQAMLEAQYGALDTQMASMNSLSSYVTQQVAQWAKSG